MFFVLLVFVIKVWRYKNDAWEDTIYELSLITYGEWLEADESRFNITCQCTNGKCNFEENETR